MTQLVAPVGDDLGQLKRAGKEARPSVCISAADGIPTSFSSTKQHTKSIFSVFLCGIL
jgi:hypothetical protein